MNSPQSLCRGNLSRSIKVTRKPVCARRIAKLTPAGPAPTTTILDLGFGIWDFILNTILTVRVFIFFPIRVIRVIRGKKNMKIIPLSIPTPFYIGDVNVYLIKEDPLTLIDVGPKTVEAEVVLREKLKRSGVEISDIKRILLTHTHEDHFGLAKQIRDESGGAEIFIHRWETGHLTGRIENTTIDGLLLRAGVSETVIAALRAIYKSASSYSDSLNEGEFSELKDGAEIEFASGVLKVLHTPGHTPGSCCFWREANRTLIAGDTILKRITPNPLLAVDPFDKTKRFKSLGEYLVSLAKIKSCAPTLIHGGHGEPVEDFDELFNRYVRAIDDRQKKVISMISGKGATAYEIAGELFPAATNQNFHQFLAISETVAHLDYAESEGKIAVELKDGAENYRRLF